MDIPNLPQDFPTEIRSSFRQETYKGRLQRVAHFEYKGKRYKLVVTGGVYPSPGHTYTVYPDNSPNGHIVFVRLYKKKREEELWSNYDDLDFDYDAWRERQEELYWEREE